MNKIKGKKILIAVVLIMAAMLIGLGIFLFVINEWSVTVSLNGSDSVTVEYEDSYEEEGAQAYFHGSIVFKKGWPIDVIQLAEVDLSQVGSTALYYTAEAFGLKGEAKRVVDIVDTKRPKIVLTQNPDTYTIPGEVYVEEGFHATDNYDGDLTSQVLREEKNGFVYYSVSDSSGNTATAEREIYYWDPLAPELVLNGDTTITLGVGVPYEEPGYTAKDNVEGDLTAAVQVTGAVDASKIGTYTLTYSVADAYNNVTTLQRTIIYEDTIAPEIRLKGDKKVTITAGSKYKDSGCDAADNYDGDLKAAIKVDGRVNTYQAGTYTLTYTVADSSGNTASVKRTVVVKPIRQPDTVTPSGKVIYLTFDDGPGQYTQKLLDILAKYNVKATFFTINNSYSHMLKKEAAAGHTVAIHSATHNFAEIYASEDAYFADLEKQQKLILNQTGKNTKLLRFPGGSSNRVSIKYNQGIMTRLASSLTSMGYKYFDWNVDSNDAGGATTADEVFQNVITGVQKRDVSIVLQHDIKGFSVDAVEMIVVWGLANGYKFLPLSASSPTAHHTIRN